MKTSHTLCLFVFVSLFSSTVFSQDYIELAKQAYNDKKYYDVVDYATKALNVSASGAAYWWRGMGRYYLKNYQEALGDFRSATSYYSDNSSLGNLYYWRAECEYEMGDYRNAISDFESAKNYGYENKADLYWFIGNANTSLKEYTKAMDSYTTAIGYTYDNKTLAKLYKLRADAKDKLYKSEDAIADYTKALEYDPNYIDAFWMRGYCRAGMFQDELAIGDYTSAINLLQKQGDRNSDIGFLLSNRGRLKYLLGNYDEAKTDMEASLKINPNDDKANRNMADILFSLKNYKEANKYYLQAASLYKEDIDRASCYSSLYWSCRYMLDYTQAINYINSALRIYVDDKSYLQDRAYALAAKKDYANALKDYDKVVELYGKVSPLYSYDSSTLAGVYRERAKLKFRMKDNSGALADFKRTVQMDSSGYNCYHLGRFYKLVLKQNEQANFYLQKAIMLSTQIDTTSDYIYSKAVKGDKVEAVNAALRMTKKENEKKDRVKWNIYNTACVYAITGDAVKALQYLDKSLAAGFDDFDHIYSDEDWDSLRATPGFKAILTKYKAPTPK